MSEKSAVYETSTIAEMTNGIILANYEKILQVQEAYQSEAELEESMIKNLVLQGYEKFDGKTSDDLYKNLKIQIEKLNKVTFTDEEWKRFLIEYLDSPNDGMIEKTRKIQENHIYDFIFDDGHLKNIKIIYTVIDESISQLISSYITDKSAVKVVMLRSNNSTQAKTVYIKNEQEFVHKFLENLPEKPLKLAYKDK